MRILSVAVGAAVAVAVADIEIVAGTRLELVLELSGALNGGLCALALKEGLVSLGPLGLGPGLGVY